MSKKKPSCGSKPPDDPFQSVHRRKEWVSPDLAKIPVEPEEDILLFIRDHNPQLAEWEKDLLTMATNKPSILFRRLRPRL